MGKVSFKPGTMLSPLPVIMASCGDSPENYNIITIGWTGIINSEPPMTYISVRKSRHSHHIIERTGEYVINLCNEELTFATDFCGVKSGKDMDKFEAMNLTPMEGEVVKAPLIKESPINLECKVTQVLELPTHDVFISEIVKVHVDEELVDENGKIHFEEAKLVAYNHGEYFGIKRKPIGKFGYSVMKPKTKKRLNREKAEEKRLNKEKAKANKKADKELKAAKTNKKENKGKKVSEVKVEKLNTSKTKKGFGKNPKGKHAKKK